MIIYNQGVKGMGDKNFKNRRAAKKQEGVTLIISLVLLAVVTFISFALSTVILRELAAVRLILRAEPALSGANSGGEVGLYQLIRQAGPVTTSGSLVQSGATYSVTTDLFDDPYVFSIGENETLSVALYDPENFDNQNANFGYLTVTNNPGSESQPLRVEVYSFSDLTTTICSYNVGAGQTSPTCGLNSADDRYFITLVPNGGQEATGIISVRDNNNQPKGVPADSPTLDILGTSGPVQRKIQINLR